MAFEFDHFDDLRPGRPAPMPRLDPGPGTAVPMPRIDPFAFSGSVGPNGDNRREDVIKAQILLGNSGHYRIAGKGVPTGWPGGELFRSIRAFQKEKGLQADGLLLPPGPQGVDENGAGETLTALQGDLGHKLAGYAAPTPQEVDAYYENEARFSGAPDDGDTAKLISDIFTYDESGRPVGMKKIAIGRPEPITMVNRPATGNEPLQIQPRHSVTDIDPPQPAWQDDGRLAMAAAAAGMTVMRPVATPSPLPAPPQDPSGKPRPPRPHPHEDPAVEAAGRQLEKIIDTRLGYAAANMKRWYENGQAFVDGIKRQDLPLNEAEQAAFTTLPGAEATPPSRPMSDPDQAAAKTPPLTPPRVDTKPQGRPAEERQPEIEKLIPPEMKEWHEGLEPVDQRLVREWMILNVNKHGSLGKPSTQLTDLKIAKLIAEERKENFPELEGIIKHIHGSYVDGVRDNNSQRLKQEHIPGPGPGNIGSRRPDITVGHADNPDIRGRLNSVTAHWKDIGGGAQVLVHEDNEVTSFSGLLKNIKNGTAATIAKIDAFPNEQMWEAHARPMIRWILAGTRQQTYEAGLLQSAEPPDLPPPGTFE